MRMEQHAQSGHTEIERVYLERTAGSRACEQAASRYLPGGSTRSATDHRPYPLFMQAAEGCYLTDVDDNPYIDFMNNYTVLILGHGHAGVKEALSDQMQRGMLFGAPSENQTDLAQIICERVASVDQLRFTNTGTEAVMYAFRAARAFTGRDKILKMEGGFHGNLEQTEISVSPDPALAGPAERPASVPGTRGITEGMLRDVLVAPLNNLEATEAIIRQHKDDLAAVIIEPMMGASGMIPATHAYLEFLREMTARYDILLIFDEIITFRLAPGGYQSICGVDPDLTTFGKIIGGGLPIGAFGGRQDIMQMFSPKGRDPMHHSGTFNGNAITMAAGIATMKEVDGALIARINAQGETLRRGFQDILERRGIRGQVTGFGSLMNVHFSSRKVTDLRSSRADWAAAHPAREQMNLALKNQGIYTPNRLMFSISAPMAEEEIRKATAAFEGAIDALTPFLKKNGRQLLG